MRQELVPQRLTALGTLCGSLSTLQPSVSGSSGLGDVAASQPVSLRGGWALVPRHFGVGNEESGSRGEMA